MKFLIVGLGSMGKRRLRNLKKLNETDIIGFDVKKERCKEVKDEYNIETYSDITNALNEKPNAMIISTPPDLHMKYANLAVENNIHFFIEASVLQEGIQDLMVKLENKSIVGVPSSTMRFHPLVLKIMEILNEGSLGKPLAFTHHTGQYLPDWHPWENYREFYVAKKETGACREIVAYDLVWLTYIFGEISKVSGIRSKVSNLEIDIDDIYNILIECKNGILGTLVVDVLARVPIIEMKILTEYGVIFADWINASLKYYSKDKKWVNVDIFSGKHISDFIRPEDMYEDEIESFLKLIKKEIQQPYTLKNDLDILKILEAIEKSSDSGTHQIVKN